MIEIVLKDGGCPLSTESKNDTICSGSMSFDFQISILNAYFPPHEQKEKERL